MNKLVYEWAKEKISSIDYYLTHDWIYAFDVDYESEYEYKQHCKQLEEVRTYLEHAKEYLKNEINDYEQEQVDLIINEGVYY